MRRPVKISRSDSAKMNVLAYVCDVCNFNCWYCYNKRPRSGQLLDLNSLHSFLKRLHSQCNHSISLDLIGGEPTRHPKLLQFCKDVKPIARICIYTNMSLPIVQLEELAENGVTFEATWHRKSKDFIDKIMCLDSSVFRAITVMDEPGASKVIEQIRALHPTVDVDLQPIIVNGKHLTSTAIEIDSFRPFTVTYDDGSQQMMSHNELDSQIGHNFKNWTCQAGKQLLYIHVNGIVYPCDGCFNISQHCLGTINDDISLRPIICPCNDCPHEDDVSKEKIYANR